MPEKVVQHRGFDGQRGGNQIMQMKAGGEAR